MSVKKFNQYIEYVAEKVMHGDKLDYDNYMKIATKINNELNSNFSFDPNENMFDGSSKKRIMLDYNFTIIVKHIYTIYEVNVYSLPLTNVDEFEKKLTFLVSKFNTLDRLLSPISKHANTILNKQTITKINTIFPYYFYEFLEYNKLKILQMFKQYFLNSELNVLFNIPNSIDFISEYNPDFFNHIKNTAKQIINTKYLNYFKEEIVSKKTLKETFDFIDTFTDNLQIKYVSFLSDDNSNYTKKYFVDYYFTNMNDIFIVLFRKELETLFNGQIIIYTKIKYYHTIITHDLKYLQDLIKEFLLNKLDLENDFMASYKHVVKICLEFFDKYTISLINKEINLPNSNEFAKQFSKHITNDIKEGKILKDSPEYFYAYELVDKEALWIYYQSNLTKRLIMNSDLILNNEYKYLDNLKEFPNIQKLYLMLFDYSMSQSISTTFLSKMNVNILFCRDQIWPMKRENKVNVENTFPNQQIIKDFYETRYDTRKLIWKPELFTCTMSLTTEKGTFDIIVNNQIVSFLQKFNELDKVVNLNIDEKYFAKLLKYKIFKKKDNLYIFNKKFKCKQKVIKCYV